MLSEEIDIETLCAVDSDKLDEIKAAVKNSGAAFAEYASIMTETNEALECSRINDIFVELFQDALCTSSPSTFVWIFSTGMVVYILGMFIILFRGALLPVADTGETFDDDYSDYE